MFGDKLPCARTFSTGLCSKERRPIIWKPLSNLSTTHVLTRLQTTLFCCISYWMVSCRVVAWANLLSQGANLARVSVWPTGGLTHLQNSLRQSPQAFSPCSRDVPPHPVLFQSAQHVPLQTRQPPLPAPSHSPAPDWVHWPPRVLLRLRPGVQSVPAGQRDHRHAVRHAHKEQHLRHPGEAEG